MPPNRTILVAAAFAVAHGSGAPAAAADWELQGLVGRTAPTYSQTFTWSPPALPQVAGVTIQQSGSFDLTATGGLAFGGSLSVFPTGAVGLEARIDTGDVTLETRNARFTALVPLPAPLPDLDADVELEPATVELERLTPLSLNLRLRTPGKVALSLSGGISYLPRLEVAVIQPLALGVRGFEVALGSLDLGRVPVRATPDVESSGSKVGANLGLGLQIRLSEAVSLTLDARGFLFPEQRLVWTAIPGQPLNPAEEVVVEEVLRQLAPIEFSPTLINATAGIAISF